MLFDALSCAILRTFLIRPMFQGPVNAFFCPILPNSYGLSITCDTYTFHKTQTEKSQNHGLQWIAVR